MVLIIISRHEPDQSGTEIVARRLAKSLRANGLDSRWVYLEDFRKKDPCSDKDGEKIAYFMTNDFDTERYFEKFVSHGWVIVNKDGLQNKYTKFHMQKILKRHGIKAPKNMDSGKKWQGTYPVYIKSFRQMSRVRLARNKKELSREIDFFKRNREDYYLEQAVTDNKMLLHKIYHIRNRTIFYGKYKTCNKVTRKISKILGFGIFSADIFISPEGDYQVIDINPAPGLYKSEEARALFAKYLHQSAGFKCT